MKKINPNCDTFFLSEFSVTLVVNPTEQKQQFPWKSGEVGSNTSKKRPEAARKPQKHK